MAKNKTTPQDKEVDVNRKKADALFKTHTCDEFYFTSDGTAFTQKHNAAMHASSLANQDVITIKREE